MKRSFFALLLAFSACSLCAQATRGLSLTTEAKAEQTGNTYALIVGISKYKNPAIPPLEFADRDAVAFRNYLVACGVDSDRITLLTNEKALYSEILLNIHELATEKAQKGDRVYIYFSGHGDVESKVMTQDGYLLPYDAPKLVYAISALNVRILQEYVSTMSAKGVEVIVITDACHSGKLAGGIEGLQNIAAVLKENWKDEIKFLSCQPGEISLENTQWGNGRGLFSYELINGMAGMADKNKDGKVTLLELNLYLSEHVNEEAKPLNQNPLISGNMNTMISKTNPAYLASIKTDSKPGYTALALKGYDDVLLNGLNDSIKRMYFLYKKELEANHLGYRTKDTSAWFYYCRIPDTKETKTIAAVMKRNLTAALIGDLASMTARSVRNDAYTQGGYVVDNGTNDYSLLRKLLAAAEIKSLGLLPKLFYADALNEKDLLTYPTQRNIDLLDSAVRSDPDASYASGFYAHSLNLLSNFELSKRMALKAVAASPGFIYAYHDLIMDYLYLNMPDSALYYTGLLNSIDTIKYIRAFNFNKMAYEQVLNDHGFQNEVTALGYFLLNKNDSADLYFRKRYGSIKSPEEYRTEALLLFNTRRFQQSLALYQSALAGFSDTVGEYATDKYDITDDPMGVNSTVGGFARLSNIYLRIAGCYIGMQKNDSAVYYLDKSIGAAFNSYKDIYGHPQIHYYADILIEGFSNSNHIPENKYLDPIRSNPGFKALMKKYFPNKYKG